MKTKLTPTKIKNMRQKRAEGWTLRKLGRKYQRTVSAVYRCVKGITFKNVM